jgi:hypothetical protein
MPSLFNKYLAIHGGQIEIDNTSKLLIRCKILLRGRKILG